MVKLVLANSDFKLHTSNENEQLQAGLELSGWTLAGFGYGEDSSVDVRHLLRVHKPSMVFISNREDWDAASQGCFDKRCSFQGIKALASHNDIYKIAVVKDANSESTDRRQAWCEEIRANIVVIYYHGRSVLQNSPWLKNYQLVRTWHSIDSDFIRSFDLSAPRSGGIVTGATSKAYPLREMAFLQSRRLGISTFGHPGYKPEGRRVHTPEYLRMLSGYKIHLATASRFGFALRKIIESVAVGCTPVTNLPAYDVLPFIDEALVRVPNDIQLQDLKTVIEKAAATWNLEQRLSWARKAWEFYDWKKRVSFLSEELGQRCVRD